MPDKPSLIIRVRALGWAINLTRLNILLLIATTVLVSVPQGRDLLLTMAQDAGFRDYLSLLGSTLLWATSIWLWARVLLDIEFPDAPVTPQQLRFWRKWLPRILGLLAFVSVTVNLGLAIGGVNALVVLLALEGAAFMVCVWRRRAIGRWLARQLKKDAPETSLFWADEIDGEKHRPLHPDLISALGEVRGRFALATLALGVLLGAWGLLAPLSLGQTLDTLLLLMLWGATLLPIGSVITYWGNTRGVPVMLALLLLVLGSSFFNDNHAIRTLDEGVDIDQRPQLTDAIRAWKDAHCTAEGCAPFTVVATAGGGIRAAYWTGTVLGDLHDRFAEARTKGQTDALFEDYLFAISGVSGGSVGATVYRSVAANQAADAPIRDTVQQILGEDYLGPVSAGLLYPDMLQRFIPWPVLSDRAAVFEQGLEEGFLDHQAAGTTQLDSSFVEAASFRGRPWPALFLNSTWSDNGRRIVAATLDTRALSPDAPDRGDAVPPLLFKDLLGTLGKDMRLSTAAHNSARFPIVSPAGGWKPQDLPDRIQDVAWQRLQDGGLFENYGAETAVEILEVAQSIIGEHFQPLVILISSDPSLPDDIASFDWNRPVAFAYEVRSTLHTYTTTRVGRGTEEASRLRRWAETRASEGRVTFAYYHMCASEEADEPPLGWALSSQAQIDIGRFLDGDDRCAKSNQTARARVFQALSVDAP